LAGNVSTFSVLSAGKGAGNSPAIAVNDDEVQTSSAAARNSLMITMIELPSFRKRQTLAPGRECT
jgi:hypothetical protein